MRNSVERSYAVSLAFALAFFALPAVALGGVSDAVSIAAGVCAGVTAALAAARVVYDATGVQLIARSARDYAGALLTVVSIGIITEVVPGAAVLVVGAAAAASALLGLAVVGVVGSRVIDRVAGGERR